MALFAGALLAAGCSREDFGEREQTWQRKKFPGFSVELPAGKVVESSNSPSAGKLKMSLPGSMIDHLLHDVARNGAVSVGWSSQALGRDEWRREFLPMLVQAFGASIPGARVMEEEALDEDRWIAIVGTDRVPVAMGVVRCDDAFAVDVTYAHYHEIAPQLDDIRRLLRSVRCNVGEENRTRLIAAVRLPAKFGLESDGDGQVYRSIDGETVAVNLTVGDAQSNPKIYRDVVKALLVTSLGVEIEDVPMEQVSLPGESERTRQSLIRVSLPATNEIVYVGARYCEQQHVSLMSFWIASNPTDTQALERIGQIDCPGVESNPTQAFEALVEAACLAGDKPACEIKNAPPES